MLQCVSLGMNMLKSFPHRSREIKEKIMLEQHQVDLSYTHQSTSIGLEIRTEAELKQLISALQKNNDVVVLHNHHRDITVHIYMRFREKQGGSVGRTSNASINGVFCPRCSLGIKDHEDAWECPTCGVLHHESCRGPLCDQITMKQ